MKATFINNLSGQNQMIYPFARILYIGLPVRTFIRKVHGSANIPKPPFIFASNHASYLDDIVVPYFTTSFTNTKFHIFVNSRFYSNLALRVFLNRFECIKVDVGKDVSDEEQRKKTNEAAFQSALGYLRNGEIVGIFPEGGRSPDGRLRRGKTGAARLAFASGMPVVPIGIKGSYEILPKGAFLPRLRRGEVSFGKPIHFKKRQADEIEIRKATDGIMEKIAELIK